jgi:CubicO group peptidase (beta-lactamase class C family)
MQGEVHDENTWALGGVAPHSGLFGNMEDLSKWILRLREIYLGKKKSKFISQETAQIFFKRAISQEVGDFALGFMMKSAANSTAGTLLSKETVGHTGFTGTSFWFDTTNDLVVNILSNRVFYGRQKGDDFRKLRSAIHDLVFRELV